MCHEDKISSIFFDEILLKFNIFTEGVKAKNILKLNVPATSTFFCSHEKYIRHGMFCTGFISD